MHYFDEENNLQEVQETTFSSLNMTEADLEEIIRKNTILIADEDESLLVVGQQVRNKENGRCDLTAIDGDGNLVLIELKRDRKDIESRTEPFEFQAIRYAASYATISTLEQLARDVYSRYIEKHKNEFDVVDENYVKAAITSLHNFYKRNELDLDNFNGKQRIILVASDFDPQTLSAVAWLVNNNVDITCFRVCPYVFNGKTLIDMKKVLPLADYQDFYVGIEENNHNAISRSRSIKRTSLPKIDVLLANGVVKPGEILQIKGKEDKGALQANGCVVPFDGDRQEQSLQQWLKKAFGWSSVETYRFTQTSSGKTLSELRSEWMSSPAYKRWLEEGAPTNE